MAQIGKRESCSVHSADDKHEQSTFACGGGCLSRGQDAAGASTDDGLGHATPS